MKEFLAIILAVFLSLPGLTQAQVDGEGEWRYCPGSRTKCPQVTDTNFIKCIETTAKKSFKSLSDDDYLNISVLDCSKKDIKNIAGIENFTNLTELYLDYNQISDTGPLAKLTRLTKLYLFGNNINDISPLTSLSNLKELHFEDNQVEDISVLAKLSELDLLGIGYNQVSDISPLAGLRRLTYLELYNNRISDISSLATLNNLSFLNVSGNSISDISPLKKLTGLKQLSLNSNEIYDISPLANLTGLTRLGLKSNYINDINLLAGFANLYILDLDNNMVSDLSPLSGLNQLNSVSLLNNCIKNIYDIGNVDKVTGLEYQHNLCSSPNLLKKIITYDWLDEQVERQCIEYDGENDYSLKGDYEYYPDGIYYNYHIRNSSGAIERKVACKLSWNSNIDNFIGTLEEVGSARDSYQKFMFGKNHIYVQDGKIRGYSVNNQRKVRGEYSILKDISELFRISYTFKKQRVGSSDILTAMNKEYVVRIVDGGENYSLQFFERGFFDFNLLAE